jgi:hypothetical protein
MTDRFEATDERMRVREILADNVEGHLSRGEQEYSFSGFGDRDYVEFTGYVPTMVKSVLRHRFAKVEWVYLYREHKPNERVEDLDELVAGSPVPDVEGVRAIIPVGALLVKGTIRANDQLSGVFSTPEQAAKARAAFAGDEGGVAE